MTAAALPMTGERRHVWNQAAQQFVPVVPATGVRPAGFIKGPLPLDWMQRAARLPGKTLQVALALWYLAGLQKSLTVKLASGSPDCSAGAVVSGTVGLGSMQADSSAVRQGCRVVALRVARLDGLSI